MNGARFAFLDRICELVRGGEDIYVVSADYAAPMFDDFRRDYSSRFVSVGIAEQNMIAVSCGLAMAGKRVIGYSLAPFTTIVPFNQLKNAVALMHLPITIVTSGIGFAIPEGGSTHYNAEDIALIRTLPGFRIITPTDNIMGTAAADYALTAKQPLYIRFDKNCGGKIYDDDSIDFEKGFAVLNGGSELAIITCGYFTHRVKRIIGELSVNVKLIDLYALPFDKSALLSELDGIDDVLTIEEHVLAGGIGSAIVEFLSDSQTHKRVTRMGIDFGRDYPERCGNLEYFLAEYGLSDTDIANKIKIIMEAQNVR